MDAARLKFLSAQTTSNGALAHVMIQRGRMQSGNGSYAVEAETDLPDGCVHGQKLTAVYAPDSVVTCDGSVMTIKNGKSRTRLPCLPTSNYPLLDPDPQTHESAPGLTAVLQRLHPFVATGANKPWATSICLDGDHGYATNSFVMARAALPVHFAAPVNLPAVVVPALAALGDPVGVGIGHASVTFHFADGAWLRTGLIDGGWPIDTVEGLVKALGDWTPVSQELKDALRTAGKIADDPTAVVQLMNKGFSLIDGSFAAEDIAGVPADGRVKVGTALLALGSADDVQWHFVRDRHGFRAGSLVGVFAGSR